MFTINDVFKNNTVRKIRKETSTERAELYN